MTDALRALNRFGMGGRVGEAGRLSDPRGWLIGQLDEGAGRREEPTAASETAIAGALEAFRAAQRSDDQRARAEARRRLQAVTVSEGAGALVARATSEQPFVERLVAFWSDHLCVAIGSKVLVGPLAGSYERHVIRANVLGKFEDMVLASAKHPAMLVYLDNAQSVGPDSPAGRLSRGERPAGARPGARRRPPAPGNQQQRRALGLNENYARELLELHTLGVAGGYTQQDVTELARLLTGWTTTGIADRGVPRYAFMANRHEPGRKTILAERYGDGEREGERAIRAFCRHASTANHLATKLVRHFVADEPPAAAVEKIAKVFRESEGDLKEVARALVQLSEPWEPQHKKFRTPQDWLTAVMRAANAREAGEPQLQLLRQLRMPLWSPGSPKGFGDLQREWADPDSLLNRAELARTISQRRRMDFNPTPLATTVEDDGSLAALLGDSAISVQDRVAIGFASPAFQWR
jgi:uncharacterized protein (DUF1800 family)